MASKPSKKEKKSEKKEAKTLKKSKNRQIGEDKYKNTPDWVRNAEFKLDRYNHLMEFLRTFLGFCTLTLQIVILLKLFNVI
jgi:hypothetical protein